MMAGAVLVSHKRDSEESQEETMMHIMLGDVFVRVDDLDARERERVAKVKRLVSDITGREDDKEVPLALVAAIAVVLCFLFGSFAYGSADPFQAYWVLGMFATVVAGVWTYMKASSRFRTQTRKDLFDLGVEVKISPRCRQLLDAYLAVHPSFGRLLPQELLTPHAASA